MYLLYLELKKWIIAEFLQKIIKEQNGNKDVSHFIGESIDGENISIRIEHILVAKTSHLLNFPKEMARWNYIQIDPGHDKDCNEHHDFGNEKRRVPRNVDDLSRGIDIKLKHKFFEIHVYRNNDQTFAQIVKKQTKEKDDNDDRKDEGEYYGSVLEGGTHQSINKDTILLVIGILSKK